MQPGTFWISFPHTAFMIKHVTLLNVDPPKVNEFLVVKLSVAIGVMCLYKSLDLVLRKSPFAHDLFGLAHFYVSVSVDINLLESVMDLLFPVEEIELKKS